MNARVWTQKEFVRNFIVLYKDRPCLWKVKSEEYSNRIKKDEAYNELLEYCRITDASVGIEFVKSKINSIRTSYRKELTKINKSIRSGASGDKIYVPQLWYFNLLDFLREQDGLCPSRSSNLVLENYFEEEEEADEHLFEASIIEESDDQRINDIEEDTEDVQQIPRYTDYIKQVKGYDQKPTKRKIDFLNNSTGLSTSEREQDEFDALGLSVSKKLRKMDRLQQLFAENLINKALFLGSMGQLNINSDVQPVSSFSSYHSPSTSSTSTLN